MVHCILLYPHHPRWKLVHILMLCIGWLLHAVPRIATKTRGALSLLIQNHSRLSHISIAECHSGVTGIQQILV